MKNEKKKRELQEADQMFYVAVVEHRVSSGVFVVIYLAEDNSYKFVRQYLFGTRAIQRDKSLLSIILFGVAYIIIMQGVCKFKFVYFRQKENVVSTTLREIDECNTR